MTRHSIWALSVLTAVTLLSACGSEPSEEKVRYDVAEWFNTNGGLLSKYGTSEVTIHNKNVIAEDRIVYTASVKVARNDVKLSPPEIAQVQLDLQTEGMMRRRTPQGDNARFLLKGPGESINITGVEATFLRRGDDWLLQPLN